MELPPRPDLPREIEQPELIPEAQVIVTLGVNREGNRVTMVGVPDGQTADLVTLVGMLERAEFVLQASWNPEAE